MIGSQAQLATSDIAVPAQNSAANVNVFDVIGNKTDDNSGDSLYARIDELYDQFQEERFVYPTLADGAAVISANTDWAYGAYATVVPANVITDAFHIMLVSIEACNRDAVFQLQLYQGEADAVITSVRFAVNGGYFGNQLYDIKSAEVPTNARVRARLASSNGTAQIATAQISIVYFRHN